MTKNIVYILIAFMICANAVFAQTQNAYVQYNGYEYEFKKGDELKFLNNADKNMQLYKTAQIPSEKTFYLQEAMRYYFLLSLINSGSIEAQIGLGRVYDEMKEDRFAKKHFFNAVNLNSKNPAANLYFADFYYKRDDLISAMYYYKTAYQNGYWNNYSLNYRLGEIYEKLADIETAKAFYFNASRLKQDNQELLDKIRMLDGLNYSQSQYYIFKK
ncbi:MAG: hypothetical protein PHC64_00730 [Candidatus Gastranaerophilales bacterium]|nr:hypothetical protein [Candidatus Gastranaerophilales bacterium]